MRNARTLNHEELINIALAVQAQLYLDDYQKEEIWNPDKEWSPADICEALANKLSTHNLTPQFLGDTPDREPHFHGPL